jgi:hypothetical protein
MPTPIPFDPRSGDVTVVRQVLFSRLRHQKDWNYVEDEVKRWVDYVVFDPVTQDDFEQFWRLVREVFYQLVSEGVLVPGRRGVEHFPAFQLTGHGRQVLADEKYQPHDEREYLAQLHHSGPVDGTVLAYLTESLRTFRSRNYSSSMLTLGIAAERVFIVTCASLRDALRDPNEQQEVDKILGKFPMKPKVDWFHKRLDLLDSAKRRPRDLPELPAMLATFLYNLMRLERNDLGHPQDAPPQVRRDEAYALLQTFPTYYLAAEELREWFVDNQGQV